MWATAKMAWLLSALANQHHSQELVVTNIAGQEAKGSVGAAARDDIHLGSERSKALLASLVGGFLLFSPFPFFCLA
jgi:hypothetical protein